MIKEFFLPQYQYIFLQTGNSQSLFSQEYLFNWVVTTIMRVS
jgi:hypothetical protein